MGRWQKAINSGEYLKSQGIKVVNDSGQDIPQTFIDNVSKQVQDFTNTHKEFIESAPIKLKEIRFVDSVNGHPSASGVYRENGNIIEININTLKK